MENLGVPDPAALDNREAQDLAEAIAGAKGGKYLRFVITALGSVPWVGGLIAATAALAAESEQGKVNNLTRRWVQSHEERARRLEQTLADIVARLELLGDQVDRRLGDESYLALVGQGFRAWDRADTDEKRRLIQNVLGNAAGTVLCSDDIVRMFIEWLDRYHEIHFKIIAEIFRHPGTTRGQIWRNVYGEQVREDSAEADLFRLMIRDLSTGGIARQQRPTTPDGRFVTKRTGGRRRSGGVAKSSFDDTDAYVLTELGKQFVHYAMNEIVPRIADHGGGASG